MIVIAITIATAIAIIIMIYKLSCQSRLLTHTLNQDSMIYTLLYYPLNKKKIYYYVFIVYSRATPNNWYEEGVRAKLLSTVFLRFFVFGINK